MYEITDIFCHNPCFEVRFLPFSRPSSNIIEISPQAYLRKDMFFYKDNFFVMESLSYKYCL